MATRCCSPPDNSDGLWSSRSCKPTRDNNSRARATAVSTPMRAIRAGRQTFSSAVSSGNR